MFETLDVNYQDSEIRQIQIIDRNLRTESLTLRHNQRGETFKW